MNMLKRLSESEIIKFIKKQLKRLAKLRPFKFFNSLAQELNGVEWLSRKQTVRYTILVISCLVLGTLFILLVDQIFVAIKTAIL